MSVLTDAARAALDAHDRLEDANDAEPASDEHGDGMPFDPDAWLFWHAEVYLPAFSAWKATMGTLQDVMGESFPGTHPMNFRPVCKSILSAVA